jgi:serine/threonine protein kinase/formylglycine-generating enzyme required for sulfatase activity
VADKHDLQPTLPLGQGVPKPAANQDAQATLPVRPANAEPATVATVPADRHDLQATVPVRSGDSSTLATVPAAAQDQLATLPMSGQRPVEPATVATAHAAATLAATAATAGLAATLPVGTASSTSGGDAATLPAGTGSFLPQTAGPGTGTFRTAGGRTIRTRINDKLPADDRALDQKLQTSRTSALADMATSRQSRGSPVPASIRRQVEAQGTEGRYVIDKALAKGGMGAVLLIEDHDFRRQAAMKIMRSEIADNADAVERFLAEAQVTAQLEHPNIVPVHDVGVMDDGTLYYTMKLLKGESLGTIVKLLRQHRGELTLKDGTVVPPDATSEAATRKWSEFQLLLTFLKVLDGVGFANSQGVIHRDLKPDNVMLGIHGEVLVVDWGIAKVMKGAKAEAEIVRTVGQIAERKVASVRDLDAASETMAGSAMGTPQYMPPEQALGELDKIDARSDVYALGATLYELLSLKKSVTGSTIPELIGKVTTGRWTALDEAAPHLHPDLVAIVHKAMALDPAKRYGTCAAMSDDLRRYMDGKGVSARQRGVGELIKAWIIEHRRQLLIGAGAIVLAGAAVAGTAAVIQQGRVEKGREVAARIERGASEVVEGRPAYDDPEAIRTVLSDIALAESYPGTEAVISRYRGAMQAALGAAVAREDMRNRLAADRAATLASATESYNSADSDYTTYLSNMANVEALNKARGAINFADKKVPRDEKDNEATRLRTDIAALRQRIEGSWLRVEESKKAALAKNDLDAARAGIDRLRSVDPVAQAADFDKAVGRIEEKLKNAGDYAVPGTSDQVVRLAKLTADAESRRLAAAIRARADENRKRADEMAAAARAMPPEQSAEAAKELEAALNLVREARKLVNDEALAQLERQLAADADSRQRQARRIAGTNLAETALGRITGLLDQTAGPTTDEQITTARDQWGIADANAPQDDPALRATVTKALLAITARKAEIDRRKRLAEDLRKAGEDFAAATASLAELTTASRALADVTAEAAALDRSLRNAVLGDKNKLFELKKRQQTLRTEVAERWAATEGAASSALARLAEQPDAELDARVRNLLAQVYDQRRRTALREQNLAEIKAFTNLITRLGPKVTGINLTGAGSVRIDAPAGTAIAVRRLVEAGNGILGLSPSEPATTIQPGEAATLAPGHWQAVVGGMTLSFQLDPEQQLTFAPPAAMPAIQGQALRWVPPGPGTPPKGFLLSETEVSVEDYLAFMTEPPQFKLIAQDFELLAASENGELADSGGPRKMRLLPSAIGGQPVFCYKVELDAGGKKLASLVPSGDKTLPVTSIDRDDAEAFCAWLAKRSNARVRLPTQAERAWAAAGGDTLRIYPWGPRFDGQFAITNWVLSAQRVPIAKQNPFPVATPLADTGPFGHRHLAGNVREWLGDRGAAADPRGGLVAGGSYTDASEFTFRSDAVESVNPKEPFPSIGFRILVEIP